ncbi:MAG TPA: type II toxin-antitoxin system HicA family toxin [Candidatus Bathyarchaeia archaeon]|nr:type II toxin-antitoxin system HicA family toxin [Candidatus Bathyarchaeia archaeon]
MRNPRTGRLTSVHVHGNRDIPLGTLRAIVIEQAGLSPEQFNEL